MNVLGTVHVSLEEVPGATVLTAPKRVAVLAYLVLARPRGLHSRDTLIAMFWPEASQEAGRHALRNVLTSIRNVLGDDLLVTAGDSLVGIDHGRITCDALLMEADIAAGRPREAIARYEGALLHGFHVSSAPGFEHWLDVERRRLLDALVQAAWVDAATSRAAGDLEAAAQAATRAARLSPDDEPALRRLLGYLGDAGQRIAAIRAYEAFSVHLAREFGVEPSPETRCVIKALRGPRSPQPGPTEITTLAVLPFMHDAALPVVPGICEALSAGVFARLARVPRFIVRARGVTARYASAPVDPIVAGRELDVDAIVVGRVVAGTDPGELIVHIVVIRVGDEHHLYAESFAARYVDLSALENRIAAKINEALGVDAADLSISLHSSRPAMDGEAYILYVRGNYLFLRAAHGGNVEDMNRSRVFFEQAIERDPNFALARAGLSNYFAAAAARNILRPFLEHFGRAIEICRHVLELDPMQAIPHIHFGVKALYLDGDWETAGREFAIGTELDPLYAEGRRFYGVYLGLMGRTPEALRELREAVRLEPHIAMFRNSLADAHMSAGNYREAISELRTALEVDPCYAAARNRMIRCHERLGRFEEAVEARRAAGPSGLAVQFSLAYERGQEHGYREAREQELRTTIAMLEARITEGEPHDAADYFIPVQLRLALAHAELGEWDLAREWEEHACRRRPSLRRWFRANPELSAVLSS